MSGTSRQKHTTQCRNRMEGEMAGDERVQSARRRREEFIEKVTVPVAKDEEMREEKSDGIGDIQSAQLQPAGSGMDEEERKRVWKALEEEEMPREERVSRMIEMARNVTGMDIDGLEVNLEEEPWDQWQQKDWDYAGD